MIASILIIAVSLVLFLYWFRYTCVLILSTRTTRDYGAEVARANQLNFVGIQNALQEPEAEDLDSLRRSLDRDYRLVTSLMKQASGLEVGGDALEEIMRDPQTSWAYEVDEPALFEECRQLLEG